MYIIILLVPPCKVVLHVTCLVSSIM